MGGRLKYVKQLRNGEKYGKPRRRKVIRNLVWSRIAYGFVTMKKHTLVWDREIHILSLGQTSS